MKNFKKIRNTVFKIGLSVVLLYVVFTKIEFGAVWVLIRGGSFTYLALAMLAFLASQWLSSFRLLLYFRALDYRLSTVSNHILYLIGMFYNFFIPGGIGGDAYKVYLLNKTFKWEIRPLTFAVLNDRLSGLIAILLWIEVLSLFYLPGAWRWLVLPAFILTLWLARLLLGHWFPAFRGIFNRSLLFSAGVQGLQLLCVYFILIGLGAGGAGGHGGSEGVPMSGTWDAAMAGIYFLVFLSSSLLSVLSFSGIGVREWLFLKASEWFAFDPNLSVSTALIFSFLTAAVSLFGVIFQFRRKFLVKAT